MNMRLSDVAGGTWLRGLVVVAVVAWALLAATAAEAQQTVVCNWTSATLLLVDLSTGDRTELAGPTVGSGDSLSNPGSVVQEASGTLIVSGGSGTFWRVDPATGDRTVLSSDSVGTGETTSGVFGLAVEADGTIIASSGWDSEILRVDPTTGDRTVIASLTVGSGAAFASTWQVAVEADGTIVYTDYNNQALVSIDPSTLVRTVISSSSVGGGVSYPTSPFGFTKLPDGDYAVAAFSDTTRSIVRVDPDTGDRTTLTGSAVGSGSDIGSTYALGVDTAGTLYVADFSNSAVVSVDATTGDRTVVSSSTVGTGTDISNPLGFLGNIVPSIVSSGPTVSSAVRVDTSPTNAASVDYTVTFSEAVTGVDSADFTVTTSSGDATGSVSSAPTTSDNISYTVTVSSVAGDGTLRLDVNDSGTGIENGAVEALDGGYTSGEEYTVDNTAPAVPGTPDLDGVSDTNTSTDDITNDTTPNISGTSDASVTITLTSDLDGSVGSTTSDGSGDWAVTASTLQEGVHSLTATATDSVGNVSSASTALSVTFDTTAPDAPSAPDVAAGSDTGDSSTDDITNDTTPDVSGTAEADSTVALYSDLVAFPPVGDATTDGNGDWSVTTSALQEGTHNLYARVTDVAGNVSPDSTTSSITVDTTAPSTPASLDLAAGSDTGDSDSDDVTNDATPDISGTAEASSSIAVTSDLDGSIGSATADGSGDWSITASTLQEGAHSLTATATDTAGNASSASTALSATVDTTSPTVSAVGATTADGTYGVGDAVDVTVALASVVTVDTSGGTPALVLDMDQTDRAATYSSGTGTNTLTFSYTIQTGDNASDLDYVGTSSLLPNSGTVRDAAGNDADVTLPTPGGGQSLAGVKAIVVLTNQTPVADDQSVSLDEDGSLAITLTSSDGDGDALTYTVGSVSNGALTGTAPSLTYTPTGEYAGADSFTFTVNDGTVDSSAGTVTITVNAVNDAPTLDAISDVAVDEDATPSDIALAGVDEGGGADEDSQTLTLTASSSDTAVLADPTVTGTTLSFAAAVADANGTATVTVTVDDGEASNNTVTQTFTVTVSAVNDAPALAAIGAQSTDEDTPLTVALSAPDVDGESVTFTAESDNADVVPTLANETSSSADLTLTATADYNGSANITVTADDGTGAENATTAETVALTVNAVNDAPVADTLNVSTVEDLPADIALTGSDVDADALTYSVVTQPTSGTLSGTAPALTYTPNAQYNGSDSFTFRANDGSVDSAAAAVTVAVASVNDRPTALHRTVSTTENVSVTIALSGSDPDGTAVTYAIASQPRHGALDGSLPNVTYTPENGFAGTDLFTYTVSDGSIATSAGITVLVAGRNSAPVLDTLADLVIEADGEEHPIPLTGVRGGVGADEAGQAVTVTATSDDTSVLPDPAVEQDDAGVMTLVLAPPVGAVGVAVVSLVLVDDGPSDGSNVNQATVEFSVTVVAPTVAVFPISVETGTVTPDDPRGPGDQVTVTIVASHAATATYSIEGLPRATDRAMAANPLAGGRTRFTGVYIVGEDDPDVTAALATITVSADGAESVSAVAEGSVTIGGVDVAEIDSVTITPDSVTNGATLTIAVEAEAGSEVLVDLSALDSTQQAHVPLAEDAEAPGAYSVVVAVSLLNVLENGAKDVVVHVTDAAGNAAQMTASVLLDNPPAGIAVPGGILTLAQGLNLLHLPAQVEGITSASGLFAALGGSDDVSAVLAPTDSGKYVAYATGVTSGSAADFAVEPHTGVFAQMKVAKAVRIEGNALPTVVKLRRGINQIGIPRSGAISHIGDLFDVSPAVVRIIRHANGKFIAVVSDATDAEVAAGVGYIVIANEAVDLTLAGDPWQVAPLAETVAAAPGLPAANAGTGASLMIALGRVMHGGKPLDGVQARVTDVTTGVSLDDTVGATAGAGQFQAAFLDPARTFRVGDAIELTLTDPTGTYRDIAPIRQTLTAEHLRDGAVSFGDVRLSATPARTAALANYPNPFNPETWIPFELRASAEVTVSIYDAAGSRVRVLSLGRREPGVHTDRERAAHWDGRNDRGETVASGVYYYEMRAGDYRETRRMTILK
ncbi:tandem-95 repeat protein [Candidatus Poribacteria bacterium]|nr:tandem-95 repeat protein [Candidatus Poribacteria bacterium]